MRINAYKKFPKPDNVTNSVCDRYAHCLNDGLHWWISINSLYDYQVEISGISTLQNF